MKSGEPAAASKSEGRRTPRITVVVKKRPASVDSRRGVTDVVRIEDPQYVVIEEPRSRVDTTKYIERHEFKVDRAFDSDSTNEELYHYCVKPLILLALKEKARCSCFAYGQTGSGKTYTMLGPQPYNGTGEPGVFELAAIELFNHLESHPSLKAYVSFYEIYCGRLYDLLQKRKLVAALENGKKEVIVKDLKTEHVTSKDLLLNKMIEGVELRKIGANSINDESSRSHAVLQIDIKGATAAESGGKIAFIDLAGSERGADTINQSRSAQQDGAGINRSLLALKECIRAMDSDSRHIPFRDSELTKVLRDIFVGKSHSLMIANINPAASCCEPTLNTLRYATRVKNFRNVKGSDSGDASPVKNGTNGHTMDASTSVVTDSTMPSDGSSTTTHVGRESFSTSTADVGLLPSGLPNFSESSSVGYGSMKSEERPSDASELSTRPVSTKTAASTEGGAAAGKGGAAGTAKNGRLRSQAGGGLLMGASKFVMSPYAKNAPTPADQRGMHNTRSDVFDGSKRPRHAGRVMHEVYHTELEEGENHDNTVDDEVYVSADEGDDDAPISSTTELIGTVKQRPVIVERTILESPRPSVVSQSTATKSKMRSHTASVGKAATTVTPLASFSKLHAPKGAASNGAVREAAVNAEVSSTKDLKTRSKKGVKTTVKGVDSTNMLETTLKVEAAGVEVHQSTVEGDGRVMTEQMIRQRNAIIEGRRSKIPESSKVLQNSPAAVIQDKKIIESSITKEALRTFNQNAQFGLVGTPSGVVRASPTKFGTSPIELQSSNITRNRGGEAFTLSTSTAVGEQPKPSVPKQPIATPLIPINLPHTHHRSIHAVDNNGVINSTTTGGSHAPRVDEYVAKVVDTQVEPSSNASQNSADTNGSGNVQNHGSSVEDKHKKAAQYSHYITSMDALELSEKSQLLLRRLKSLTIAAPDACVLLQNSFGIETALSEMSLQDLSVLGKLCYASRQKLLQILVVEVDNSSSELKSIKNGLSEKLKQYKRNINDDITALIGKKIEADWVHLLKQREVWMEVENLKRLHQIITREYHDRSVKGVLFGHDEYSESNSSADETASDAEDSWYPYHG